MTGRFLAIAPLALAAGCGGQAGSAPLPAAVGACTVCHSFEKGGPTRTGPNLYNILGEQAGTRSGYAFSPAMKASGIVWTPATLDAFLAAPQKAVPGTRMGFAGEPDAAKRQAIIAYIQSESAKGAEKK